MTNETRDANLEAAIQARGRALLAGVKSERLIALTPDWWQERLLQWATADPDFRVNLLRFVDVLPTLRTPAAIGDHVRQYFRDRSPLPVRVGAVLGDQRLLRPVLSRVVREGVFAMSGRFIGGPSPEEVLPRLRELNESGTAYTVDLLGEATLSEAEADEYLRRYLALIASISSTSNTPGGLQPNISIKLSALTSHFEAAGPASTSRAVRARLVPLLRAARQGGVFVNIDMEQYRLKDLVHELVGDVLTDPEFDDWPDAGIVVQAYLRDAAGDLRHLQQLARRRRAPITVRLVKGAYWDEETILAARENRQPPVFVAKGAADANYEACSAQLLGAYPHLRPAFGTHNPRSIAQAMVRASALGVPPEDVEFQMLYGMADGLRRAVQAKGYLTRVYVPVGAVIPGMAYLVRRLLENTSNESWLMHRHEEGSPDELLQPPDPEEPPADEPEANSFRNHPPLELYRPEVRAELAFAVASIRAAGARRAGPVIDGRRVRTGSVATVRYPAHPDFVVAEVEQADAALAGEAVVAASATFGAWRDTPADDRAAILWRAADLLAERRNALIATMVFECGKPWREADGDVTEAIDYLRYYGFQARRLARGGDVLQAPGESNRLIYEARGVAAVISPWNFPLAIPTGMTAAALAAGCTVILKPAEQAPLIASELVGLLHEAGVPAGAVNYLPGPGEVVGQALVDHPDVGVIAFTGSHAVGLNILKRAAVIHPRQPSLKRVVLELGGKNAIVVDDDADLDQAVAGVLASAFGYAGQKCSAASRVVVLAGAYAEFRQRLAAAVESLVVGPPDDAYPTVPPVISGDAKERIEAYMQMGAAEGRVVARAQVPGGPGHYVAPIVLEGLSRQSRVAREEIFGPVLALWKADSFTAALEIASDSDFALTGGVFSRNPRHLEEARGKFRVGNLYLNRKTTGAVVGRQPFGGVNMSGTGDKAGGPDYLLEFMVARSITEDTMRRGFAPVDER